MRHLILLTLLAMPFHVNAAGFFKPAFSYTIDNSENNGTSKKISRRMIDLGGGYIAEKGLTVMGQYSLEKKKTINESASSSTTTNSDRTSLGVGGGWTTRKEVGPYIHGIYYLQSEEIENGITYKGSGYEMDLGFKASIRKLSVAFQLSYRSFNYDKRTGISTGPGAAPSTTRKQTNLDPTLALFLEF